ncbi:MAG: Asp-tRNA(Asn)/Glu-tRNA(Gln) amidotransferase A subunit family amidase [Parasphingorhabdus sp.]
MPCGCQITYLALIFLKPYGVVMTEEIVPTVRQYVEWVKEGRVTSEQMVQGCLSRIDETDADIGAWETIDREQALDQARKMDDWRRRGRSIGALHGIPIGIKDIFDTADLPTQRGSSIYAGRQPDADCAVVEKLREAGAIILGKTVTTEFAWLHPANTRNPLDHSRTPGGSSSGSAAAVAAGQVPLAIGSQTGGSTIRPASFCGVYGFKPGRGIISRRGVLQTSATLDQVGVFSNDLGDTALLADVLAGYDAADSSSYLSPRPAMYAGYLSEPPVEPNFAWIDMPYEDHYSQSILDGVSELGHLLGKQIDRFPAPASFVALIEAHKAIYEYEIFRCLEGERQQEQHTSDTFKSLMQKAGQRSAAEYQEALEILAASEKWFEEFFNDYDAILTPSALGEAPAIELGTGDPACCVVWTLCGLPCLSMPLLVGESGLPIGIQLVGGANEDDRLFRSARWLVEFLRSPDTDEQAGDS